MRAGTRLGRILAVVASVGLGAFPAGGLEGALLVHDPSPVVKCEGRYYVFGTGRGIPILASDDGYTWQREGKVFETIPESVHALVPKNNGTDVWAPQVIFLNGEYYLYYSISSWGQFVSAVGLATNPTLNQKDPRYKWTDRGPVVHSGEGENLNAIDPGVLRGPDGRLWITYGSYHGNIEEVELDAKTGLRIRADSPVTIVASQSEASQMAYHEGFYYLFVNHGSCCQGAKSTYTIRVGRSKAPTGPFLDRNGEDMARGGGSLFLAAGGRQVGPGQFGVLEDGGVEKFSCHFEADLDRGGRPVLEIRPLLWRAEGWPEAGRNLTEGAYQVRAPLTGRVLGVAEGTGAGGLEMEDYLLKDGQKWQISPVSGGLFKIVSVGGSALTASADGSVEAKPFAGAAGQLWRVDERTDGSYRVRSKESGLVLIAETAGAAEGVVLRPDTGTETQRWEIAVP